MLFIQKFLAYKHNNKQELKRKRSGMKSDLKNLLRTDIGYFSLYLIYLFGSLLVWTGCILMSSAETFFHQNLFPQFYQNLTILVFLNFEFFMAHHNTAWVDKKVGCLKWKLQISSYWISVQIISLNLFQHDNNKKRDFLHFFYQRQRWRWCPSCIIFPVFMKRDLDINIIA